MKLNDIISEAKATDTAVKGKKFIIVGNPGRSMPSALYPKTEAPKLYTEAEAKRICAKMNETKPGAPHSPVHWHYKGLDVVMGYISGTKAGDAIRKLQGVHEAVAAPFEKFKKGERVRVKKTGQEVTVQSQDDIGLVQTAADDADRVRPGMSGGFFKGYKEYMPKELERV